MYKLTGVVQNYAWGHPSHIARLLDQHATEPQAEYWLGAHPRGAAITPSGQTLDTVLAENPVETLGADVFNEYGQLPYLMKILAAAKPLSIQCHPSKAQAEAGFSRENNAGVSLGDTTRTYRDDNHKPELICALTSFQAKVGFRPLPATVELFGALGPDFDELVQLMHSPGDEAAVLAEVLRYLLGADAQTTARLVASAVERSEALVEDGGYVLDEERSASLAWTSYINQHFPGDIGVVVALLLNHVSLEPGQAIGLQAGNLHAYLEGVGIEIMANSDNVIRGGLTQKHIDIDELIAVVTTSPQTPNIESGRGDSYRYSSPSAEFSLSSISSASRQEFSGSGPEIWLVTDGKFTLETSNDTVDLATGEACFLGAEEGPVLVMGEGQCWRAAVG